MTAVTEPEDEAIEAGGWSQPYPKVDEREYQGADRAYPKQSMTRWAHMEGDETTASASTPNPQTLSSPRPRCADLPVSLTPVSSVSHRDLRRINSSARA
uniref:Uncharacterized protein n=1 Tax=Oryza punctata TaxID=4537 RepID=A0A0E0KZH3_ORYPU